MIYRFGRFELEPERRSLRSTESARPVALTGKLFDVLVYLIEHRGHVIEKRELLEAVWPNVIVEEANLPQTISMLRRALGDSRAHEYIATISGRGYQFVAAVDVLGPELAGGAGADRNGSASPDRVRAGSIEVARSGLDGLDEPPAGSRDSPSAAAARPGWQPERSIATGLAGALVADGASGNGDVHLSSQASLSQPVRAAQFAAPTTAPRWLWPAAVTIAVVAVALVIAVVFRPRAASVAASEAVRFDIARGTGLAGEFVAISPDGRRVAFGDTRQDGSSEIWVRSLETQEAWPLGTTFEAQTGRPFWSADSRYVIFSAQGKIRRVDASGGPAQLLGDVQTDLYGGFTTGDGRLVYSEFGGGALETSVSSGTPMPLDLGLNRAGALTPSALPDGSLVYCQCVETPEFGIYVATPGAGPPRRLLPDRSTVQYAPSPDPERGYVLFKRGAAVFSGEGTLMAQAIHPRELRLIGDPVPIAENVIGFSASDTGVLVYGAASNFFPRMPGFVQGQLTWFDREGRIVSTVGEPGIYRELALSPDQQHVAVVRADPATRGIHIHLVELARGVSDRLTFPPAGGDTSPVWAPDGASVIFARFSSGKPVEWYRRAANLAGDEELLFQSLDSGVPTAISPDGRFAVYFGPTSGPADIKAVDLTRVAEAREPISLVSSEFHERYARLSPDGRWFAYASNESGITENVVRPFDPDAASDARSAGGRVMASKGGGATFGYANWRADGKELFYVSPDGTLMAVAVSTEPTFSVGGAPQALFKLPTTDTFFAVSRDGERFLIAVPDGAPASPPPYRVILNWTSTLR